MRRSCMTLGALAVLACAATTVSAQQTSASAGRQQIAVRQGDFVIHDFKFEDGETLPELRLHYRTLGRPRTDAAGHTVNAVYIMHGTTGAGTNFLVPEFAGVLFGPGQLLDTAKYYVILPDGIGHGQSSKPSDGLHARFPDYGYRDMIRADHTMLTQGLHVDHLRLVMGTSMGGMHTWLWGEMYPDFMDALMPLASLPVQVSGRNRVWRKMLIDAIRTDPGWDGGDYTTQPRGLRFAAGLMYFVLSNPRLRYEQAPTLAAADRELERYEDNFVRTHDANDVMYAFAASEDYDPAPDLDKIQAPLIAVNTADDLINPPDLGILQKEIKRVKHGRAVVIPESPETVGHSSHTKAVLWQQYLAELLRESAR
ncbi:MAG: alpha/beta fold hydrolase [Gemmatimonadetes bacterium]|nr:alpha/beta fold hydrolase [Gemmatimonadota bacterium]